MRLDGLRRSAASCIEMTYSNPYMNGQIWAQALARGRSMLLDMQPSLTTRRFGRTIASYEQVDSTNAVAAAWAASGGPDGAVVTADHQIQGRGRHGRTWSDAAGKNLMFSLLLKPPISLDRFGLIMLAACTSVAESVASVDASLPVSIKWPNDILIRGRKCCGLLMETSGSAGISSGKANAIVGVGLNVNQDEFPDTFPQPATSVALETGRLVERTALLASILNLFEPAYDGLEADEGSAVRDAYLRRLETVGEFVRVYAARRGDVIEGRVVGVSDVGALLLETEGGVRTLTSGEITFHPDSQD